MAQPGGTEDWRLIVLFDAAREAVILDALPGAPGEVASTLDLDEHAVVVVLEALAVFGVVQTDGTDCFSAGPQAPSPEESATLAQHARSLRRWSGSLPERLSGAVHAATPRSSPELLWLLNPPLAGSAGADLAATRRSNVVQARYRYPRSDGQGPLRYRALYPPHCRIYGRRDVRALGSKARAVMRGTSCSPSWTKALD